MMADRLAELNDRSTYTEAVAHEEIVNGVTVTIYACDTGVWMGKRDTYHRAELDGEPFAIGRAGEQDLTTAITAALALAAA